MKYLLVGGMICFSIKATAQKLYAVPNFTFPFSGLSYARQFQKDDIRPYNPRINLSWGISLIYQQKRMSHKLSVNELPFGEGFKLKNKFLENSIRRGDSLLGFLYAIHEDAIDHFVFSYSIEKEGKKGKGFLFHSQIRFNWSLGTGISFNRSQGYYDSSFAKSSGGMADTHTYHGYDITIQKKGIGLFLLGDAGFDFINKKGRRRLCFKIFYIQGLVNMARFNIHYQYGYFNDSNKQVDVPNQILYHRGTSFGFSIGFPVKILK